MISSRSSPLLRTTPAAMNAIASSCCGVGGQAFGDFAQRFVRKNPASRTIVFHRSRFAPRGEQLRRESLCGLQSIESFEASPCVLRLGAEQCGVFELARFFFQPLESPVRDQCAAQIRVQRHEVTNIVRRVVELFIAQRSSGPIGARMALRKRVSQTFRDQIAVTDLRWMTEKGGRELGIENRPGDVHR